MQPLLLSIPTQLETERLVLRCYQPDDAFWYYEMSQRNRYHLARYEAGNAVMRIHTKEDAEQVVSEFAESWEARRAFFLGAFLKGSQEFVAQIYIGVVSWDLPEFELGYFVDVEHEGKGYVTEASKVALRFIFNYLHAQRVRLECDDTNVRSYTIAERCGMILEAHFPENKENPDGSRTGTYHYALTKENFIKGQALKL
jgi:RimJ/RimL family protein N-acetyltransferase